MKTLHPSPTALVALLAVFALGTSSAQANLDSGFDLERITGGLSTKVLTQSESMVRGSLAKSKCRVKKRRGKKKGKRKGGIRYKKPDYKIRAPQKSEADRLKEKVGGLEYLKGKGLSPESPLARKSPAKKTLKK